ncbi:MAG: dihydropteroate synthase [Deltaproteobacteria bacterium]|nr:dihydropteroate synthase [Deltaproteobacteria bacterium]
MLVARTIPPPIRAGQHVLHFENRTLVLGVLNVTPDSFSDGGRYASAADAVAAGVRLWEEGADILDVGGESTRPGAEEIPETVELQRVVPVVEALAGRGIPVSVDTRHAPVAAAALKAGAGLINDVTALTHDPAMVDVAGSSGAAVILMHMRGAPRSMQQGSLHYDDVVEEVTTYLEGRVERLVGQGLTREQLLIDPGMGFGKGVADNVELMTGMERLTRSGRAVVWGPSRKSTLGHLLGGVPPAARLMGTVASCVVAVAGGAHVVRVHDVAAVRQALAVADAGRGAFIA